MHESYLLEPTNPIIKLLHLTDHHLFADPHEQLLGITTHQSFQAVLNQIANTSFAYDCILDTGDLVQHDNPYAYHQFAQMVQSLQKPLFWTIGNHDSQDAMTETLARYAHIQPHKQILAGQHWQILLLDSHQEGIPAGKLSNEQLDWLAQKLSEQSERFSLIVLHHNILPTNSQWLDQHSLANADALLAVLKQAKNVKGILHGHIHQEVDSLWHDYQLLATPSTCIQFKPNCDEFTLDSLSPGWREIELHPDGKLVSQCKRLRQMDFLPDFSANGY